MKSVFVLLALLVLLAACTSQPPTTEAEAAPPEFVEVEPVPLAFADSGYKTPEHLRSTGGANCAPLPETGVATLYCNFVKGTAEVSLSELDAEDFTADTFKVPQTFNPDD